MRRIARPGRRNYPIGQYGRGQDEQVRVGPPAWNVLPALTGGHRNPGRRIPRRQTHRLLEGRYMIATAVTFAVALIASSFEVASPPAEKPVSVVLVHGAFVDGSGWQAVYDILTKDGYEVLIVQNPTTTLKAMLPPPTLPSARRSIR
jgi:hypothetical protein